MYIYVCIYIYIYRNINMYRFKQICIDRESSFYTHTTEAEHRAGCSSADALNVQTGKVCIEGGDASGVNVPCSY